MFGAALSRRIAISLRCSINACSPAGNIYAAEACVGTHHPRAPASSLSRTRQARLLDAIRAVLAKAQASAGRYRDDGVGRFEVYGREGEVRCGADRHPSDRSGGSVHVLLPALPASLGAAWSRRVVHGLENGALDVSGFRYGQDFGVVQRLADEFRAQHAARCPRPHARSSEKQRLGEMVAAARRAAAAGREQSHGAQVDLGSRGGRSSGPVWFRERRRVEYDRVERFALSLLLAQVVEGVGLDALDVR